MVQDLLDRQYAPNKAVITAQWIQGDEWTWFGERGQLTFNETMEKIIWQEKDSMYTVTPPEYIPLGLTDKFFLFDGKCKVVEGLPKDILGDGNLQFSILGMVGPYKAFVVGASVTDLSMPKFYSKGTWFFNNMVKVGVQT